MSVEFIVPENEVRSIADRLESLGQSFSGSEILNIISMKLKNDILNRTQTGRDADGKPFKKYSAGYSSKEGKTVVNLTKTGLMLNSMTQKIMSNDTAMIFFSNPTARERAKIHNNGTNKMPQRKFFAFGVADNASALKTFKDLATKELKKRGL